MIMAKMKIEKVEDIVAINGLKSFEQETSINFYRDSDIAIISTTDNTYMTKIKALFEKNSKDYEIWANMSGNNVDSYTIKMPKKLVSLRVATKSRNMTEEQKQAAAERMRKIKKKDQPYEMWLSSSYSSKEAKQLKKLN